MSDYVNHEELNAQTRARDRNWDRPENAQISEITSDEADLVVDMMQAIAKNEHYEKPEGISRERMMKLWALAYRKQEAKGLDKTPPQRGTSERHRGSSPDTTRPRGDSGKGSSVADPTRRGAPPERNQGGASSV